MSSGDNTPPRALSTPAMHWQLDDQPDTPPNRKMTAAATVFALPELLENILLHLDNWKQPFVLLSRCVPAYGGRPDENAKSEIYIAVYDGDASGISFDSMRISKGTSWRKALCFQLHGSIETAINIIPCVHDNHAWSTRKIMEPDPILGTFIDKIAVACHNPSGIKCPHYADYGYDSNDSY
ncbi:hypothetical protein LTR95_000922 [Oleoguttula sp. CCFEE 5521]